jgi:hypothetical protein
MSNSCAMMRNISRRLSNCPAPANWKGCDAQPAAVGYPEHCRGRCANGD